MKKFTKNAAALIMAMIMVFSTAGFNTAYVQAADGTVQGTLIATREEGHCFIHAGNNTRGRKRLYPR